LRHIFDDPIEATITFAWVTFLLYWGVSAIRTKSTTKNRNLVVVVLMAFALVGLFLLLRYVVTIGDFNLELWHRTLPFAILSVGIVLLGLFVLIWARRALGSSWNAIAESTENQHIVQAGPYRHIRHPMYTGFLAMVLGSAMAYGHLLGVLILAVFIAGFWVKANQEELILKRTIGPIYKEYWQKTKAFIPFII
jgi:protein-S-isoprenylcysteine O-methyltransferase Ste14